MCRGAQRQGKEFRYLESPLPIARAVPLPRVHFLACLIEFVKQNITLPHNLAKISPVESELNRTNERVDRTSRNGSAPAK